MRKNPDAQNRSCGARGCAENEVARLAGCKIRHEKKHNIENERGPQVIRGDEDEHMHRGDHTGNEDLAERGCLVVGARYKEDEQNFNELRRLHRDAADREIQIRTVNIIADEKNGKKRSRAGGGINIREILVEPEPPHEIRHDDRDHKPDHSDDKLLDGLREINARNYNESHGEHHDDMNIKRQIASRVQLHIDID